MKKKLIEINTTTGARIRNIAIGDTEKEGIVVHLTVSIGNNPDNIMTALGDELQKVVDICCGEPVAKMQTEHPDVKKSEKAEVAKTENPKSGKGKTPITKTPAAKPEAKHPGPFDKAPKKEEEEEGFGADEDEPIDDKHQLKASHMPGKTAKEKEESGDDW